MAPSELLPFPWASGAPGISTVPLEADAFEAVVPEAVVFRAAALGEAMFEEDVSEARENALKDDVSEEPALTEGMSEPGELQ